MTDKIVENGQRQRIVDGIFVNVFVRSYLLSFNRVADEPIGPIGVLDQTARIRAL